MALTKKDLLMGMSVEEVVQNAEDNFTAVFDALEDGVGMTIGLSVDPTTYVMTLELKNSNNETVSKQSVDLPIESLVMSARYDEGGVLTLTLQNGTEVGVDISDLVSGLVHDKRTINGKPLSSDITLTQDDVGDGTTYKRFTQTEKTKLAGIAANANNYVHPSHTSKASGLYKITVDATGHVSAATAVQKSDITALGIPGQDTTYSNATTSKAGLMSATDKEKLDSIDDSLLDVSADDIGKVKDVKVNGESKLGADGVAAITIEALKSGYVNVTTSELVSCTVNDTTYKAIKVVDTDTALEVFNSGGDKILTHTVRKDGYLYICVGTNAIACTLRKVGGSGVGGSGGSSSGGAFKLNSAYARPIVNGVAGNVTVSSGTTAYCVVQSSDITPTNLIRAAAITNNNGQSEIANNVFLTIGATSGNNGLTSVWLSLSAREGSATITNIQLWYLSEDTI